MRKVRFARGAKQLVQAIRVKSVRNGTGPPFGLQEVEVRFGVLRPASLQGGDLRGLGGGCADGFEMVEDLGPSGRECVDGRAGDALDGGDAVRDGPELDAEVRVSWSRRTAW